MNCQEFTELAGAYVLGALTPEEQHAADAHLAGCADCRQLLQELQSVADLLPLTAPSIEPSPALQERVLGPIRADAARRVAQQRTIHQRQQPTRPYRRYIQRSTQLLAIAALLLLFMLGGMIAWNVSLHQQLAQQTIYTAQSTTYAIRGTDQAATASGEAIYLPQLHTTIVVLHGLPALTGTRVYQGWLIQGHQPSSIGLLNEQQGTATLTFPGNVSGYTAIAVSLEPGPQASKDAPQGQIIALGSLSHPQAQVTKHRAGGEA